MIDENTDVYEDILISICHRLMMMVLHKDDMRQWYEDNAYYRFEYQWCTDIMLLYIWKWKNMNE